MKISKLERQLNLIICLLATDRPLTASQIRIKVSGYDKDSSYEAFTRMFERDKAEIRSTGIPLTIVKGEINLEENAYTIRREDYELPDISLRDKEIIAVSLALDYLKNLGEINLVNNINQKLFAAGFTNIPDESIDAKPELISFNPDSNPIPLNEVMNLIKAIDTKKVVTFSYYSLSSSSTKSRMVSPYTLFSRNNNWYVKGYDHNKNELRTFKINRFNREMKTIDTVDYVDLSSNDNEVYDAFQAKISVKIRLKEDKDIPYSLLKLATKTISDSNDKDANILFFDDVNKLRLIKSLLATSGNFTIEDNEQLLMELKERIEKYQTNKKKYTQNVTVTENK